MSKIEIEKQAVIDYHANFPAGKLGVHATKPLHSPRDLVLAYTPGVGLICEEIVANKEKVFDYTDKGNLVGVISNGTAVLGLGNIGATASKPLMEGKAMLLKHLAGVNAFDIELDTTDPEEVIRTIKHIAPTFGGINLEDIKAPECFEIEKRLIEELDIPVMHDDQHSTAIVVGAALCNALALVNKDIATVQVVVNGAGASAIATAKLLITLGVKKENLIMCDRQGVIRTDREELNAIKQGFATERPVHTLHQALVGADIFIGLSVANVLSGSDICKMGEKPIVFALANPNPEIPYEEAQKARKDIIIATGRGDYPNQVNNILAFPYIFRGALDVRARIINSEMQQAAVKSIASLTQEDVPPILHKYYGLDHITFGKDYLLPKPIDTRLLTRVAIAVAKAAIESGVAKKQITDWNGYAMMLKKRIGLLL